LQRCPSKEMWIAVKLVIMSNKHLAGLRGVPVEARIEILRLIENMTVGAALTESIHGAGFPQTQKVMYGRLGNLEEKKRWAKRLVGID
jgi:4-hydroxybutyryl-CoA dehydratase/vinylacetyl-CoA-Delta-isomerase